MRAIVPTIIIAIVAIITRAPSSEEPQNFRNGKPQNFRNHQCRTTADNAAIRLAVETAAQYLRLPAEAWHFAVMLELRARAQHSDSDVVRAIFGSQHHLLRAADWLTSEPAEGVVALMAIHALRSAAPENVVEYVRALDPGASAITERIVSAIERIRWLTERSGREIALHSLYRKLPIAIWGSPAGREVVREQFIKAALAAKVGARLPWDIIYLAVTSLPHSVDRVEQHLEHHLQAAGRRFDEHVLKGIAATMAEHQLVSFSDAEDSHWPNAHRWAADDFIGEALSTLCVLAAPNRAPVIELALHLMNTGALLLGSALWSLASSAQTVPHDDATCNAFLGRFNELLGLAVAPLGVGMLAALDAYQPTGRVAFRGCAELLSTPFGLRVAPVIRMVGSTASPIVFLGVPRGLVPGEDDLPEVVVGDHDWWPHSQIVKCGEDGEIQPGEWIWKAIDERARQWLLSSSGDLFVQPPFQASPTAVRCLPMTAASLRMAMTVPKRRPLSPR